MSELSELIQWPRAKYWDRAWNPIVGCEPCSPACANCYAKAWARRFGQSFVPHASGSKYPPRNGVVFCGNVTDLFADFAGDVDGIWWADPLIRVIKKPCDATYIWLTKRTKGLVVMLNGSNFYEKSCFLGTFGRFRKIQGEDVKNCYFGFTAENQEWYDKRQRESLCHDGMSIPKWANMWYSLEPLLGPIELGAGLVRSNLRWVVVGCESGPNRRPCKVEWVESIVWQCRQSGVPVFVKQLDLDGKCETDIAKFPECLRIRQVPWKTEGDKQ